MRLHRTPARRRGGFTLIELIVVIAIIAALVALLLSGLSAAFSKMDEVKTHNEITGLSGGLTQFMADFKVQGSPPPSRLYLDETGTYNPAAPVNGFPGFNNLSAAQQAALTQLAIDSKNYLYSKLFPRAPLSLDWNLNGKIDGPTVLEGEQCLVFFLAGPIVNGSPSGFSTDPTNPLKVVNGQAVPPRKGPYFQFVTTRLRPFGQNGYPVYFDAYSSNPPVGNDKPYAYFSCGTAANNYLAYSGLGSSDCSLLGVVPYQNSGTFYKADGFQIISAGKNQAFGAGGQWTPQSGPSATAPFGADDISNFYDAKLGVTP
ncbi:MAG TPA: type II secretion system protein [Gemmataceae bacterium]|nr:type II secretion system protein [Gemmataceae bacterium]